MASWWWLVVPIIVPLALIALHYVAESLRSGQWSLTERGWDGEDDDNG